MGGADQRPLCLHGLKATQQELSKSSCLLDLPEHRLHDLLSQSVPAAITGALQLPGQPRKQAEGDFGGRGLLQRGQSVGARDPEDPRLCRYRASQACLADGRLVEGFRWCGLPAPPSRPGWPGRRRGPAQMRSRRAGEFRRDIAGDGGEAENLDVERCPGIAGRLKILPRVVRQPELELPARHRLTDCVVLPFELVSNGCADEVSTISVEAIPNHQVHASEIDEAQVHRQKSLPRCEKPFRSPGREARLEPFVHGGRFRTLNCPPGLS